MSVYRTIGPLVLNETRLSNRIGTSIKSYLKKSGVKIKFLRPVLNSLRELDVLND